MYTSVTDPNATIGDLLNSLPSTGSGDGGGGIASIVLAYLGAFLVIGLIWYILKVAAYWKVFTKAGEPGWKSIIPFYNTYVQYRLTWKPVFFWLSLVVGIASGFVSNSSGTVAVVLTLLFGIADIVIYVMANHRLSRSFGHGAGFTVGLCLLNPIFLLILGFGGDKYVGNTSV